MYCVKRAGHCEGAGGEDINKTSDVTDTNGLDRQNIGLLV